MPHLGLEPYVPILLYAGAIIAFLVSVRGTPFVGLCYLLLLLPLQTARYKLHAMPLGAQVVDIMLLGIIIGLKVRGERIFTRTPFNGLLAFYAIYTYLSLWRGVATIDAALPLWFDSPRLADWKNYMVLPLLFLLAVSVVKSRRQMKIVIALMCLSVLALNVGYRNNLEGRDFSQFSEDGRTAGGIGYAGVNGFAAFEAQFAAFLLTLAFLERKTASKFGYFAVAGFCVYALMFAFSRGAYAAFLIGCIFLGVVNQRKLLIPIFIFLIGWQVVVPPAVSQRVLSTVQEDGQVESSAAGRLTLWEDAMQVFKGDPIFGTGFNTYAYMGRVGDFRDTHNLFVKVLVETGVSGLAFFLYLLFRMFRTGWRLYRSASDRFLASIGLGLAVWMVSAFIANMFGDRWMYLQISGYTFTVLALAVRGQMIADEEEETEQPAAQEVVAGA
jgi:putative inorganic carbon (hco3(-)) transporter